LIPKIAHFVILTPTGNYRFLKFKSVKNNPFWLFMLVALRHAPVDCESLLSTSPSNPNL
jgi:hypothetical protein